MGSFTEEDLKSHYTYWITYADGRNYIGVRTALKGKTPETDEYFGSPTDEAYKYQLHPEKFLNKIILRTFSTRLQAKQDEIDWHNLYDVGVNSAFVNRAKATMSRLSFDITGTKMSDEQKTKLSKSRSGWIMSKEQKRKLRNIGLKLKPHEHNRYDKNIYHFENIKTGEFERCTKYELRTKFDIHSGNLAKVFKGERPHSKGWRCIACILPARELNT